jgi:alkylhydroperoxidase family enzyme
MLMAFIEYRPDGEEVVPDIDNILRIHSVHSRVLRRHIELYRELMRSPGPLSRIQREMIATVVSAANECHY